MRRNGAASFDVLGTSGDLRGAHLRWDLSPQGDKATRVVLVGDASALRPALGALGLGEPLEFATGR